MTHCRVCYADTGRTKYGAVPHLCGNCRKKLPEDVAYRLKEAAAEGDEFEIEAALEAAGAVLTS